MNDHLTQPYDNEMARKIRDTPAGMAHWTGTGPKRMTCRMCIFFKFNGHNVAGKMKLGSCLKFKSMTGKKGKNFEHFHASCRFFNENEDPPSVLKSGFRHE